MAHEIELKLRLDKQHTQRLRRALTALGAQAQDQRMLQNTYFDTPELALHDQRVAVRIRKVGRRWLQTVKTVGHVHEGLSARNEWETPYSRQFDFSGIDDAALRKSLTTLTPRLTPIFTTHFKRSRWLLDVDGAHIEVALDDGLIEVGNFREPIHELELELLQGKPEALRALAARLGQALPLTPEDASKAERGFRLYRPATPLAVTPPSPGPGTVSASQEAGMDLLLWRHAEAEDGTPDATRKLTNRGEKQARAVARWLEKHQPKSLRVISSPARRAQQTAAAFTEQFDTDKRLGPDTDITELLSAIGWPNVGAVLVVGHQPTLGKLAALLLSGTEAPWSIKKGAMWWISRRVRAGQVQVVLRTVVSPDYLD